MHTSHMGAKRPHPLSIPMNAGWAGSIGSSMQTSCSDKDMEMGRGHILTSDSNCIRPASSNCVVFAMYFYCLTFSEVLGSCQFPKADTPGSYYFCETPIFFQ